jgi:hypothetical protein
MIFKLAEAAEKSWRRLNGYNQLPKIILLALDEVEHRFDHPRRSEHLPVVGDAFL